MLASLHLHTESTIHALEDSMTHLGQMLQKFQSTTCNTYHTYELPSEEAARGCRTAATRAKTHHDDPSKAAQNSTKAKKQWVQKVFNLLTYKVHALGDYTRAIQLFGTTNGFTTWVVSNYVFKWWWLITHHNPMPERIGTSSSEVAISTGPQRKVCAWYCNPTALRAMLTTDERGSTQEQQHV